MIAYEIQLRYVIRDKIQSETKSSLRQNLRKRFFRKNILLEKKIIRKKFVSNVVSDFQCTKCTKRQIHTAIHASLYIILAHPVYNTALKSFHLFISVAFQLTVHEDSFLQNTLNRAKSGRIKSLQKLPESVDDSRYNSNTKSLEQLYKCNFLRLQK